MALQQRYDLLWAAALHLESYLHLRAPGTLCTPLNISFLQPHPGNTKTEVLLYLLECAQKQRLTWADGAVYTLNLTTEKAPWQTKQRVYRGTLDEWMWRQCDKETHWRFWAYLNKGTATLGKLLCAQPQF